MPQSIHAVLLILGCIMALGLLVLGCMMGFAWHTASKISGTFEEGTAYGAQHSAFECETAALDRASDCGDSSTCQFGSMVFHGACLDATQDTGDFCRDVPKPQRSVALADWVESSCRTVELPGDESCEVLLQVSAAWCHQVDLEGRTASGLSYTYTATGTN